MIALSVEMCTMNTEYKHQLQTGRIDIDGAFCGTANVFTKGREGNMEGLGQMNLF